MPLFEYACRDCDRHFEMFVTADRAPSCPGCRSTSLAKQLTSPGMVSAGTRTASAPQPSQAGGCGAGGAGCPCRMN